jgi:hypothetical protein
MLLMDGAVMADCITAARAGRFPLVAFLYSVLQLSQHTPFPDVLKSEQESWWDLEHHGKTRKDNELTLSFALRVLEVLLTGCGVGYTDVRMQYALCLREFFKVRKLMLLFVCCLRTEFEDIYEDGDIYVIPDSD